MRLIPFLALLAALVAGPARADVPQVVASIKPVHSLVAAVMEGLGTPTLLVEGAASPHAYSLRPSDAQALESAELVFWTGPGMELFLGDALAALAADAVVVPLAETPDLDLLPVRDGGTFAAHAHDEEHHAHGTTDMHFWLDPVNAAGLVGAIAEALAAADPGHAARYRANAAAVGTELTALTTELEAQLAPVADRPFIVVHDAYQYFEHRFGLDAAGSITVTPDAMAGARRIEALRRQVAGAGVACVFAEPQFEPAIIEAITEGSETRAGILDPEGAALEPGPDLYFELLRGLAAGFTDCLQRR